MFVSWVNNNNLIILVISFERGRNLLIDYYIMCNEIWKLNFKEILLLKIGFIFDVILVFICVCLWFFVGIVNMKREEILYFFWNINYSMLLYVRVWLFYFIFFVWLFFCNIILICVLKGIYLNIVVCWFYRVVFRFYDNKFSRWRWGWWRSFKFNVLIWWWIFRRNWFFFFWCLDIFYFFFF